MDHQRERAITAPWPVLALIAAILVAFLFELGVGREFVIVRYGFAPAELAHGRWTPLVSALFVHASWMHCLANSAFLLAFGTPVARRLGADGRGAAVFFAFFFFCGVAANLIYSLFHAGDINVVIGASGAVAGLMGAASRLMEPGVDLSSYRSRSVVVINVVFGALFVGWAPGAEGAPIAWQVHLAGYAIGLLLFSPVLRLMGRRSSDHGLEI